ncbi:LCP family protein [Yinghuangia seranimata]|uniref:LCP family protein n=1 Tax=Yinghuangia seranimata TaxID=408067 RepID=UPI00248BA3F3|nr:LCP family protein [Yinghuangia seranimata]MDI2124564.1 LCP family protein [Yinghuangia seranimata]
MHDEEPDAESPLEWAWNAPAPAPASRRRVTVVLSVFAAALVLLVGVAITGGLWLYGHLNDNIHTDHATDKELSRHEAERPKATGSAQNILVLGSDYRPELGSARSDTVLLLHIAGDGQRAQVVSVPRDLMVWIPDCGRTDLTEGPARYEQFNWAFERGGAACTIRTFEKLTGIRVDHHLVLGFEGFKRLVDAVDGVEVTLPTAERDPNVGLDLTAGPHLLRGEDALAYVRAREYVGDGSDTNRISRQQRFMKLLSAKIRGSDTLLNPVRMYQVLDAATGALTADPGLDSLSALYGLTEKLRAIPEGRVEFHTVPRRPYPVDPNRDELQQPAADELFAALRADRD